MKHIIAYNMYCMRAAKVLAGILTASVFLYGAFLLIAVSHTARLSQAEEKIRAVGASASILESTYLSHSAQLTAQKARSLGFVAPSEQWVVYAAPATLTVR